MVGICAVMAASSLAAVALDAWWDDVNNSPLWQDRTFHALAALYGVVAAVALVSPNPPRSILPSCLACSSNWGRI